MLSQDKCLPIAYKCLGFTVLFVLEKYCVFKMLFIHPPSGNRQHGPALPTASPKEDRTASFSSGLWVAHTSHLCLPTVGHRDGEAMSWEAEGTQAPYCLDLVGCPVGTCPIFWLSFKEMSMPGPGPVSAVTTSNPRVWRL